MCTPHHGMQRVNILSFFFETFTLADCCKFSKFSRPIIDFSSFKNRFLRKIPKDCIHNWCGIRNRSFNCTLDCLPVESLEENLLLLIESLKSKMKMEFLRSISYIFQSFWKFIFPSSRFKDFSDMICYLPCYVTRPICNTA